MIAHIVGIVLLAGAALVLIDVILREFHASLGGTDEISGYVMAIVTSWGMALALLELAHVRIDLLRVRFKSARIRTAMDLFALTVMAGCVTLIAWKCWPVLARSLEQGSRANTPLETPLWIVQLPWMAGWIWFALMAWLMLIATTTMWLRGDYAKTEEAIGVFGEDKAGS